MRKTAPLLFAAVALPLLASSSAFAVGEAVNGFPNWEERVLHEWMNRSRCDPQVDLAKCTACADKACYTAIAPLAYDALLSHAARFHSDEMRAQNYFAHDSACTIAPNISSLYPATCQGDASCACVGGVKACSPTCTLWSDRVKMFAPSVGGEIIAGGSDPDGAFYLWLYESYAKTTCAYDQGPPTNGHRWNILKSTGAVGVGFSGPAVGDFGSGPALSKIPSGTHYPQQAAAVDMWVNWYDTAGPKSAMVNIDGQCQPLTLKRGSQMNGAWSATVTGMGSGCHRYFFLFQDSSGATVSYPTTGSLAIGPAASCPSYDAGWPQSAACNIAAPPNGGMGTPPAVDGGASDDGGAVNGGTASTGCGCRVGESPRSSPPAAALAALFSAAALVAGRLRRRRVKLSS